MLAWWPLLAVMLVFEAACYTMSFLRFGREPCTHAYSAKLMGLALLGVFTLVLGFNVTSWPIAALLALCVLAQLDCLLISMLIPRWEHDVPSSWHALRLKQGHAIQRHPLFNS